MRVTEKGQVTIPKAIRDKLGIVPGSEVAFVERDGRVTFEKEAVGSADGPATFDEWAASVAGTIDTMGMTTDAYMDWLRGPREDLDPR